MVNFSFLRNSQPIFHSNLLILHSHQQYMLVLIYAGLIYAGPLPFQQLLLSFFLISLFGWYKVVSCVFDIYFPNG